MEYVYPILIFILSVYVINVFYRGRQPTGENQDRYLDQVNYEISNMTGEDNTVSFPVLDPSEYGYRSVGNESLIAIQQNVQKIEHKSTGRYKTSGASFSIPIVKGVRYRIGSGSIQAQKSWQVVAEGRLILTDKAVVFESPQKNERITWTQIADVELLQDGYKISKRNGPPRVFTTDLPNPQFAAALGLLRHRAA